MIRRSAPYVYLFFNGYTVETWLSEDIGDESRYRNTLDVKQIEVGLWLSSPSHSSPIQTVVTAILTGDILPFVHLLGYDEYALLCLPNQLSLTEIDKTVRLARPNGMATHALISSGGFIVTVIDLIQLKILSKDDWWTRQEAVSETIKS